MDSHVAHSSMTIKWRRYNESKKGVLKLMKDKFKGTQ